MVLVDTSVWIRFLYNREPETAGLKELLRLNRVVGHDLVYGELLVGDRGGRKNLLADYQRLPWAATVGHRDVVEFVDTRDLKGRGAGWIDLHILASALIARVPVWTADPRLAELAHELGVAYNPPRRSG